MLSLFLYCFITTASFNKRHVKAEVVNGIFPSVKTPVATGSTFDSIVLFVGMDPFDPQKNTLVDEPNHYEFQVLADCDEYHGWKNLYMKAFASVGEGFPVSTTINSLKADTCYRFRTRAVFEKGVSFWSFATEDIYTKSAIPLKVTNFETVAVETNAVTIRWDIPSQRNLLKDRLGLVDTCLLQHSKGSSNKEGDNNSSLNWVDFYKDVSMIAEPAIIEIQEVTTLVDSTSKITSGYFWLQLHIPQKKATKLSNIVSTPIAYNATTKEFQEALSKIDGIVKVRVYLSNTESLGSPLAMTHRGTFTWRVEFLEMSEEFIPLLEYYKDNFDGTVIPGKARVRIKRLQAGSSAQYRSSVQVNVTHLEPSTSYSFRVACKNKYGMSDWSHPINGVITKAEIPPRFDANDFGSIYDPYGCVGTAHNAKVKLSNIHHDSVDIDWKVIQAEPIGSDVTGYEIELSTGREGSATEGGICSDDFQIVDVRAVLNYTTLKMSSKITRLQAGTPYCIRLVAYCRDGSAEQGNPVEFSTEPRASNYWFLLESYAVTALERKRLISFHDQYTLCDTPKRPSPRRGHSLTLLDDNMYLFGGLGSICWCKTNYSDSCSFSSMYANDLWSFNTMTRVWKLLHLPTTDTMHPMGREQYSATKLANGKILYIGGRTSRSLHLKDRKKLYLGDVWELDPGQIRGHTFLGSFHGSIPASISDGSILYHTMTISADTGVGFRESDLCVKGVTVEVVFEHFCVEEVSRISLIGPRHRLHHVENSSRGTIHEITVRTTLYEIFMRFCIFARLRKMLPL